VNSDDAACGTLDELGDSIRKCDKRIGGLGHWHPSELWGMAEIWHRRVVAATGHMARAKAVCTKNQILQYWW
jgi:hypothetical protein